MTDWTVAVTRSRIDETAAVTLRDAGCRLVFLPPYGAPSETAERLAELCADALMVSQGRITKEVLAASPRLKVVVKHGSGVNNIDLRAAESLKIPSFRVPAANARAVAEHAIAMALALRKGLPRLDDEVKSGRWPKSEFIGFDFADTMLGLVGYGAIGREVARMASALGMKVSAYDPHASARPSEVVWYDDLDALLAAADVVSIHCPLTPETQNIFSASRLARMKPGAGLVNTARGGLVDEAALVDALTSGALGGAALDSFAVEPPAPSSALWAAPGLIVTPHVAGLTKGAEAKMAGGAAQIILDVLQGKAVAQHFVATSAELGGLQDD